MVFEGFGKKLGDAAQSIGKKSSEIVETTKLNMAINSENDEIRKSWLEIGKRYFEEFGTNGTAGDAYKADCLNIANRQKNIEDMELKLQEAKGLTTCTGCGAEIDRTLAFCGKCGTKVVLKASSAKDAGSGAPHCAGCGTELAPGAAFCPSCGAKVG